MTTGAPKPAPGGAPNPFANVKGGATTTPAKPAAAPAKPGLFDSLAAPIVDFAKNVQDAAAIAGDASNLTNHGELIVTAMAVFRADSVDESDVLWKKPSKDATKNHRNFITCEKAQPDQTTTHKTLCRGRRIVHELTQIGDPHGPPSENPDFEGLGGGVSNGGKYKKFAVAIRGQCSPDTEAEGHKVVRHYDPSKQNDSNTGGLFLFGPDDLAQAPLDKLRARRCAVDEMKATCKHDERESKDGRLEVVEGDEVELEIEWVNAAATKPADRKRPQCQIPLALRTTNPKVRHPITVVSRKAHDLVSKKYEALEQTFNGTTVKIEGEMLGEDENKDPEALEKKKGAHEEKVEKAKEAAGEKGPGKHETREREAQESGQRTVERVSPSHMDAQTASRSQSPPATQEQLGARVRSNGEAARRDRNAQAWQDHLQEQDNKSRLNAARQADVGRAAASDLSKGVAAGLKLFKLADLLAAWNVKPMEVRVESQACAGAKALTIGVWPREPFEVDFFELKEIKESLGKVVDAIMTLVGYLNTVGAGPKTSLFSPVKVEHPKGGSHLIVFEQPFLKMGFQYRELKRDANPAEYEEKGRLKHQVHRAVYLEAGVETVLGVLIDMSIPILTFAPGLGTLGTLLLRLADVEIAIEIIVDISVGLKGGLELDEYGAVHMRPATLTPRGVFSIGVVFKAGDFAKVSANITGSCTVPFTFDVGPVNVAIKSLASKVNLDLVWEAKINIFGWETGTGSTIPITSFPINEHEYQTWRYRK